MNPGAQETLRHPRDASAKRGLGEPRPEGRAESGDQSLRRLAGVALRVRAKVMFMLADSLCVVAGYGSAEVLYYRDKAPSFYWQDFIASASIVAALTLLAFYGFGLYGRMWRHAGVEEARHLLRASLVMAVVVAVFVYPIDRALGLRPVPLPVLWLGLLLTTIGAGMLRFRSRLFAFQRGPRRMGLRVAVVGSRDTGASAIREMLRCPDAGLVPVAVFDDDESAHGLSLMGVPVAGSIDDIPRFAHRFVIQQVLLAIPRPAPELIAKVLRASEAANVTMKVLPAVSDVLSGPAHMAAIRKAREPRIEEILGRTPVATDLEGVRRSLAGRRVLVTGAGGSIGSEICRQIDGFSPAELVLLDHDETHLHDAAAELTCSNQQALVDVADRRAVFEAFKAYRPEVVFHAAAHKHVPVLERHPIEAAKTNVLGTLNVVEASAAVGAERFVLISTDKAVRPSSVMGASKRLAEQVVLARSPKGAAYCAVRFGNVLGSRGSVIPTFNRQIEAGGPVTITDPRMTRFFMSAQEAVQLVLQASVLSRGREVFMLEMGEPVRIIDLARRMIQLSGLAGEIDIPIEIVGCRPGEKLHEELNAPGEQMLDTEHPFIYRLVPIATPPEVLEADLAKLVDAMAARDSDSVKALLFDAAVPEEPPSANASNRYAMHRLAGEDQGPVEEPDELGDFVAFDDDLADLRGDVNGFGQGDDLEGIELDGSPSAVSRQP